ncbi:Hpt domain-containing protein [Spirosoma sordidisoli]|uniref:Hpt domain-containing protein n=1 Tax=Spirosoma sordidisoli TaxID=2502893 RepID=A0A4Q2UFL7_9BACT|nr:Hpt domain-containing protein [Spirosoma sordidisoli]RYC67884.1 Hpt domain-containing protein [Spirosoma sordidisoli]
MPLTAPAIDYPRLDRLHGGSRGQIVSVLHLFLDEVMPDFDQLEAGMAQQNWVGVADVAHKIVPWVGMVGLTSLEMELRQLEQYAKSAPEPEGVISRWNHFKAGLEQALPVLRSELDRLADPTSPTIP